MDSSLSTDMRFGESITMAREPRQIQFALTPAATLYREKLLLRRKAGLPPGLQRLPGFRFATSIKQQGVYDASKLFVKAMIHVIASAIARSTPVNLKEFQFVSLAQWSIAEDKFEFAFDCPYAPVVELARAQLGTAGSPRDAGVTIRYEIMIRSGLRMPVVFSYTPGDNTLLVTHKNQLSDPSQFLRPELCKTTSGFLNFIGTLFLLEEIAPEANNIPPILALANSELNRGIDEMLRWIYCLVDRYELYSTDRILVDVQNPERFFFNYPD
jgi:hypothetical protein